MLTIKEAVNNVAIVVQNARMTGPEHDALKESMTLIVQRCQLADTLEAGVKVKADTRAKAIAEAERKKKVETKIKAKAEAKAKQKGKGRKKK